MAGSLPMTRNRWVILGCGVPVALALIATMTGFWVHAAVRQMVDLTMVGYSVALTAPPTAGQAKVITDNADITVAATAGSLIGVHGRLAGSMARPTFSHKVTSAGLILSSRCRAPIGNCSLNLDVTVPDKLPVDITDSYGSVQAGPLSGTVKLASNSGDIDVSRLTGDVDLADSYGNINAGALSGHIRLSNGSGDINVTSLTGDSQLTESYGNISVQGVSAADVRCGNQSGDITIVFATVPRHVAVSDSYGNITLELPAGSTAYQVHTSNSYGSTTVSVPREESSPNVITATNNSGDITIENQ